MQWDDFLQYAAGFPLASTVTLTPLVMALLQIALENAEGGFAFIDDAQRQQYLDIYALAGDELAS